mgnify:FL=1
MPKPVRHEPIFETTELPKPGDLLLQFPGMIQTLIFGVETPEWKDQWKK